MQRFTLTWWKQQSGGDVWQEERLANLKTVTPAENASPVPTPGTASTARLLRSQLSRKPCAFWFGFLSLWHREKKWMRGGITGRLQVCFCWCHWLWSCAAVKKTPSGAHRHLSKVSSILSWVKSGSPCSLDTRASPCLSTPLSQHTVRGRKLYLGSAK